MAVGHEFKVWADKPTIDKMQVVIFNDNGSETLHDMIRDEQNVWRATADVSPGTNYKFRFNGDKNQTWPDPNSRYQPEGVNGPSQIVDPNSFKWTDHDWKGKKLSEGKKTGVIYEAHIGTFTQKGTFKSAIEKLAELKELGITHVEVMPPMECFGDRNWGYDGTYPNAFSHNYGTLDEFKEFVNEAHKAGLAVIVDYQINHPGPEGNYLSLYGNYFARETPWGSGIDMINPQVSDFYLKPARMLLEECKVDGLRLDAVHNLDRMDWTLRQLHDIAADVSKKTGIPRGLIAESDLNDPRVITPVEKGGMGIDAQWEDGLHHGLRNMLRKSKPKGYYIDYEGGKAVTKAINKGYVHDGNYSRFRGKAHGSKMGDRSTHGLLGYIETHDQVGNTQKGKYLHQEVGVKLAKGAFMVVGALGRIPMIFQGGEHATKKRFPYFVGSGPEGLLKAIRRGRLKEFKYMNWKAKTVTDPTKEKTFLDAKLSWGKRTRVQKETRQFYKDELALRAAVPDMSDGTAGTSRATFDKSKNLLSIKRGKGVQVYFNAGDESQSVALKVENPDNLGALLLSNGHKLQLDENNNLILPAQTAVTIVTKSAIEGEVPENAKRPAEILAKRLKLRNSKPLNVASKQSAKVNKLAGVKRNANPQVEGAVVA